MIIHPPAEGGDVYDIRLWTPDWKALQAPSRICDKVFSGMEHGYAWTFKANDPRAVARRKFCRASGKAPWDLIYLDCYALGWAGMPFKNKTSVTLKIEEWPADCMPVDGEPEPILLETSESFKGWRTSYQDAKAAKAEKRATCLQMKLLARPAVADRLPESHPHRSVASKIQSAKDILASKAERVRRSREARLRMGAKLRKLKGAA